MTDIVERLRACLRFDEPKWSNCESEIELAAREAAGKLERMHAAVCQAVALLNGAPEVARYTEGREVRNLLRQALEDYAALGDKP